MTQLDVLDVSIDTNRNLLSIMLYTIKSLRNSVAHNNIIFDTRFKDRKISPVLKKWIEKETGIHNITLYSLIDYIIIVCCLVKRVDFSSTRAKNWFMPTRTKTKFSKTVSRLQFMHKLYSKMLLKR